MSSKPLVSGIIIFLNAEKFIEEAIESVFAQTYDNWELLLVDDGSTDKSTKIALRYAEQHPGKVRYLEHGGHQNRGMSASRNLGISNAKGEYIAFLDADDIWLPPKLERQVAILEAQPEAAMVYGSTQMWYSWTGNPEDIQRDRGRKLGVQSNILVKPPRLLTLFLRRDAETPATCGIMVRREVCKDIGGFEETFSGMYEDQAFFAKVCLKVPVFVEGGCWDRYRQHPNSCCYVAMEAGEYDLKLPHPAHLIFLNWIAEYLSQQEVKDTEVWKALQKAIWPYSHPILYSLLRSKHLVKLMQRILPVPVRRWLRTVNSKVYEYCPPLVK
jgi:glycosyltransferase involved in cell wall biosynthesis